MTDVVEEFTNWQRSLEKLEKYNVRLNTPHPSHDLYVSDSSLYDYKCTKCHHTDITGDGWGLLTEPCIGE